MSHQTAIWRVGAATLGAGLLGMSWAFAAPSNGAVISQAASASVGQKVVWRGHAWGRHGMGWRREWGWRTGWDEYRPVYGYGRVYGYGPYGYEMFYGAYGCRSCQSHP